MDTARGSYDKTPHVRLSEAIIPRRPVRGRPPPTPQRAGIPAGHAAVGAADGLQEPRPARARLVIARLEANRPVSGSPGGLRRDDLRRDRHRLGIESNARDVAGDAARATGPRLPACPTATTPTAAAGPPVRHAELLEHPGFTRRSVTRSSANGQTYASHHRRQDHPDLGGKKYPGGLHLRAARPAGGRPSPCPSAHPRSSRGMPPPGRAAALRPSTAEPAQAVACPLLNPLSLGPASCLGSAGSAGGARPHPPSNSGGGRAARKVEGGEYAAFRVECGLKGRRKGLPPRPAIRAGPPQMQGGHRAGPNQVDLFSSMPMQARARPGPPRRSLAGRHGPHTRARHRPARPARPASCPQARPPSWRPHGPPAARRSAAAGPRRHRRTMPRPCGLSMSDCHMWFFGSAPAVFPGKTAVLPDFRLVPPWCILVQWRSVRPGRPAGNAMAPRVR